MKITSTGDEKDQLINELEREISILEIKYEAAKAQRERLQNEQSELIKRLIY